MRKPRGYWTYENCFKEAKKFRSRSEFKNGCAAAYRVAREKGWIDEYTWFETKQKPRGYWTYEKCLEEAIKYTVKARFEEGSPCACQVARKHGWLDDYTWLEKSKNNPSGYWTYDRCKEEAQKYTVKEHFAKGNPKAYGAAVRNKWLDDWFVNSTNPNGYWNYENCYYEAKKYKSRSEFKFGNNSAYNSARKHGWLKHYVWHKDERFDLYKDKIDCVYSYEFVDQNAVYVGRTLMKTKKRRDRDHVFQLDSVSAFAKQNDIAVPEMKVLEYDLTIKEGAEREGWWIEKYRSDGWIILNRTTAGSIGMLGKNHSKYTYEVCYEEALKYKLRGDFAKGSPSAYNVAWKKKWLDDYVWFEDGVEVRTKKIQLWDYERCFEEAKKYVNYSDFRKYSVGAYSSARKNKWLDDYTWLVRERAKRNTWSDYENCYNETKKYNRLMDFRRKSCGAYASASRHGWIKDYTWFQKQNGQLDLFDSI